MNSKIKNIVLISMFSAIAFLFVAVFRIQVVMFLKYEPKDVIITIGGFIMGPLASFFISLVVSFVEMITISETGIIGFIMNLISSCSFACTAAIIYKYRRTMKGAILGLVSGCVLTVIIMLLWNYFITPIYMGYPREAVAELLVPVFLPFNTIKGVLNATITVLLYKPLVTALRKARLVPESSGSISNKKTSYLAVFLVSIFIIISCALLILILQGKI